MEYNPKYREQEVLLAMLPWFSLQTASEHLNWISTFLFNMASPITEENTTVH